MRSILNHLLNALKARIRLIRGWLFVFMIVSLSLTSFQNCSGRSGFSGDFSSQLKIVTVNQQTSGNGGGYIGLQVKGDTQIDSKSQAHFYLSGGAPPYKVEVLQGSGRVEQIDPQHAVYIPSQTVTVDESVVLMFSDSASESVQWELRVITLSQNSLIPGSTYAGFTKFFDDLLVIGSPYLSVDGRQRGVADIYQRQFNGSWEKLSQLVAHSMAGYSVDLNAKYIVLGAPEFDPDPSLRKPALSRKFGGAIIYERTSGGFANPVELQSTKSPIDERLGSQVLFMGEDLILAGGNKDAGVVRIFRQAADHSWSEVQNLDPVLNIKGFGHRVAVWENYMVVSSFTDGSAFGIVTVFQRNSNGIYQKIQVIDQLGINSYTRFAENLLFLDGQLWISELANNGDLGVHMHQFQLQNGMFKKVSEIFVEGGLLGTGYTKKISMNAKYLLVGNTFSIVSGFDHAGTAHLFARHPDNKIQLIKDFQSEIPFSYEQFGKDTTLSLTSPYAAISRVGSAKTSIIEFNDPSQ